MSFEGEPRRWLEDGSDVPSELRELLRGSRAELAGTEEVAQLSQSLARALGPEAGLGAPNASLPAGKLALLAGRQAVWLAVGAGAAIVIGYFAIGRPAARVDVPAPAPASAPAAAPPAAPELAPPARVEAPPALPEPSPAPAPPSAPSATKASTTSETRLLRRAQSALASKPSQALALTSEHQRRFPEGVLAEEREAIAIEALRRLGRESAAERRAAAFEARYPHSVHQNRVRGTSGPSRH